jgi:hypothetical protein
MIGLRRSPIGTVTAAGMRMTRLGCLSWTFKVSVPMVERRKKRKKKRLWMMKGRNGALLREVSRILLVIMTAWH